MLVLPKCFKIKKTSYICKLLKTLYRKTFPSVYDFTFIDTAQWTHSLIKLLCCWNVQIRRRESFCSYVSWEPRCILCTKIVELCLFLNKDVKQWKFCTSKENIVIDDKRSITVTFIINLHETILAMQLICGGKTVQILTKLNFFEGFLPNP